MNEVKVLICYQFDSSDINRDEVDKLIVESCEQARDDLNRGRQEHVFIRPVLLDLLSGESSHHQILTRITEADLCVFEGSTLSPNISLALGYALGQEKPCVYLLHEDQPLLDIPSGSVRVLTLRYTGETLSSRLAHEIYSRASGIIYQRIIQHSQRATQNEDMDTVRSFWGLEGEQSIYLVCPEIPENERIVYASPSARDYLRLAKFADIDTLFHLKSFIARCFPDIRVFECTCNDMPPNAHTENLVAIGGIAWNKLTAQVVQGIRLPFVQRDGGPGNPDPIDDIQNGSSYLPTISEDGSVQEDIGCFVKIPNPMNRERSLFVTYGVLVHGVLGAAKCFTERIQGVENCSFVMRRMGKNPHFATLLRVPVINNFVGVTNITKRGTLIELLGYSPERNEFT